MIAVGMAVVASMLFGTGDFLGGFASRRIPALFVTLFAMLVGFALLVPAAWGTGGAASLTDHAWSVAGGVSGGLGVALLFHVLARGPVATVAPVVAVCGVSMPAIAGIAFGERPGAAAITGIGLAALAIALVSASPEVDAVTGEHEARTRRAVAVPTVALSALSGFSLGGFLVCLSRVPMAAGLWPLVTARLAGTIAVALVLVARPGRGARPRFDRGALAIAGVSGFADALANLIYLWVVRRYPLSVVGTIVSLSPATVVLLARVVLRERFHRSQVAGLVLAGVAIVLMTWTRG